MDDKLLNIFDDLELEEAERLLKGDVNIDIDKRTKERIRKLVYKKAGFPLKQSFISRRLLACAAAALILITSLSVVGIDNVKAAISQMFSFIPGYGIVENNESINYILNDPVTTENENAILTLNDAIATEDSITVMFTLKRKNYSQEQFIKDKQKEWEELQRNDERVQPQVVLHTYNKEYTNYVGTTASGGRVDTYHYTYTLEPEEINKDTLYRLTYEDINLSLEFKLKDYQTYSDLNQIGATAYNNDISITAVPSFIQDKLEVNLYSINKSKYRINSYNKVYYGYGGRDLQLVTESGTKAYSLPDGWGGANQKYIFEVEPTDANFRLTIPYLIVQSDEEKKISLPIPDLDEEINVNKKVEFNDSTMTILSVKRVATGDRANDSLMMNIKYDNKRSDLFMFRARFRRINFWGMTQGGGYSSTVDSNDIESTVYFGLEKGDKDTLRLKISEPEFYLDDAYYLEFRRE